MRKVKFILNGCDISFCAIAPEDMTLGELLRQCDRIKPHWCACGIKSDNFPDEWIELEFSHTNVIKIQNNCPCDILPQKNNPFSYKENPAGKWLPAWNSLMCSECGEIIDIQTVNPSKCPRCGKEME